MIEIENLTKLYGSFRAVDNVTLHVPKGTLHGFLGPNGAWKTTTLRMIAVRELTKTFGRFTAVDHVSFEVKRGEIFGFLGPNGAGKSTTIRMLCGLLSSTSGTATVGGFDINREPERVREYALNSIDLSGKPR